MKLWGGAIASQEVAQRDFVKCAADCHVDFLPCAADTADAFMFTPAVAAAAFGNGNRSLKCVDYISCADLSSVAGQLVTAIAAPS